MPDFTSHQLHLFPSNPYPSHHPPPIAHKVWILDCKSCNTFLTNRGMKAVLLLRPNVSLYSSDTLPQNCSAYNANPDSQRPAPFHKPSTSSAPSRTCECLTQTLCCHTCGSAVGYMIVVPCTRCTSSISATNRATNGHRFVFHSNEVSGTERCYIQGEPGVTPFDPPIFVPPEPPVMPTGTPHQHVAHHSPPFSHLSYGQQSRQSHLVSSAVFRSDSTPPLEFATPTYALQHSIQSDASPHYTRVYSPPTAGIRPQPPVNPVQPHYYPLFPRTSNGDGSLPPLFNLAFSPADQKEPSLPPPSLKPGDVILWHNLARSGEIPEVTNDERARHSESAKASRELFFNR